MKGTRCQPWQQHHIIKPADREVTEQTREAADEMKIISLIVWSETSENSIKMSLNAPSVQRSAGSPSHGTKETTTWECLTLFCLKSDSNDGSSEL